MTFCTCCGGRRPAIADGVRRRGADRRWQTRTGGRTADLAQRLPRPHARHAAWLAQPQDHEKLRAGGYFPPFLEARKTAEKALVARRPGSAGCRRAGSTRSRGWGSPASRRARSRNCAEIDERVKAFLERPSTATGPIWLDATYLKVREGERIVSVAAIMLWPPTPKDGARSSGSASARRKPRPSGRTSSSA